MGAFLNKVFNYINEYHMIAPGDKIVVGFSGGADSVCLLCALNMLRDRLDIGKNGIIAVHINHEIRGEEADEDERFAKNVCDRLGIPFVSMHRDITAYAQELKMSVEEAGRKYRYQCFNDVLNQNRFNKIAVAHNKNDLAETVIFNMVRGSGLNGMAGIQPVRDNIIRPLLNVTRKDIEEFLDSINQDYREDSTNKSTDYDRNKIRHNILPLLCDINQRAVEHICQLAGEADASYRFIHSKAVGKCEHCMETDYEKKIINLEVNRLYKYNPVLQEHLVHEALGEIAGAKKDISRKHVMSVVSLLYQDNGKVLDLPFGIRARKSYDKLIISNYAEEADEYCITVEKEGVYKIPGQGNLTISFIDNNDTVEVSKKIYTKMANYDKIKGGLCIRTPREGDYITIDCKGNTKKLSRVFIDNKVDREKRINWPVVAMGSEIIWVIGLRYSEAYKIDKDTTRIIYMDYQR